MQHQELLLVVEPQLDEKVLYAHITLNTRVDVGRRQERFQILTELGLQLSFAFAAILTQLNRTKKRHDLARVICHGRRGEIRRRYREGPEDQLGALGLVTNAVVLWNTIYMWWRALLNNWR